MCLCSARASASESVLEDPRPTDAATERNSELSQPRTDNESALSQSHAATLSSRLQLSAAVPAPAFANVHPLAPLLRERGAQPRGHSPAAKLARSIAAGIGARIALAVTITAGFTIAVAATPSRRSRSTLRTH